MIKQLFCKHKWSTHSKQKNEWTEREIVKGTEFWIKPIIQNQDYEETTEILICDSCGKIEKLKY